MGRQLISFGFNESERALIYRLTRNDHFAPASARVEAIELDIESFEVIRTGLWGAVVENTTSPMSSEETVNLLIDLFLRVHT